MSSALAISAIQAYAAPMELSPMARLQVGFYGGEALTNWKTIVAAVDHAQLLFGADRVSFILNTNATLARERHARFCGEAGIDVHVGLDGADESTNRSRMTRTGKPMLDRALRGIDTFAAANCRLQLNTCLTHANIDGLEALINLAAEHGIDRIYAAVADLHGDPHLSGIGADGIARRLWSARVHGRRRGVEFSGPWARAVFPGGAEILPGITNALDESMPLPHFSVDASGQAYWFPYPDQPIGNVGSGEPKRWMSSAAAQQLVAEWREKRADCNTCPLQTSCNGYLRALAMYHQGHDAGYRDQCALALSLLDSLPMAYGGSARFSLGTRLQVSRQIQFSDKTSNTLLHRIHGDEIELDDEDRALLDRLLDSHEVTPSSDLGNGPRIARLLEQSVLLPAEVDEELNWLLQRLPSEFQPVHGTHCVAFAAPDSQAVAGLFVGHIDTTFTALSEGLIPAPTRPVLIFFAESDDQFALGWRNSRLPSWVNIYVAARRIVVVRSTAAAHLTRPDESAAKRLRHELVHVFIGENRFDLPMWFEEGLCEYLARGPAVQNNIDFTLARRAISFQEIERLGFETLVDLDDSPPESNVYYFQVWRFVSALAVKHGDTKLISILQATASGTPFREAFQRSYGADVDSFENHWRATTGTLSAELKLTPNLVVLAKNEQALLYDRVNGGAIRVDRATAETVSRWGRQTADHPAPSMHLGRLPNGVAEALYARDLLRIPGRSVQNNTNADRGLVTNLRLNLTDRCNMRCGYCYLDHEAATLAPAMSAATAIEALKFFFDELEPYQSEEASVRFFGGEPLLNWPVIEAALEVIAVRANGRIVRTILNTNATNIRQEHATSLARHGVDVIVSVDGVGPVHDGQRRLAGGRGSFEKVADGVETLLAAGCMVGIGVTLHHANLPHVRDLIDWVATLQKQFDTKIPVGLNEVSIVDFPVAGGLSIPETTAHLIDAVCYGEEQGIDLSGSSALKPWNAMLGQAKRGAHCSAIGNELTVNPSGEITPCTALKIKFGSINDWRGAIESDSFRALASRVSGKIAECAGCEIEAYCAGGCAADTGDTATALARTDRACQVRRALFRDMVMRFAL